MHPPLPLLGPSWMDPEHLINSFGSWALLGVAIVVIIETGLLFPFLPGDSLLFTAGLFAGRGTIDVPVWLVATILGFAALIGPQSGYWIGRGVGPRIFNRPDSRFFKQAYIDKTHAFFDKYGGRAIILGQFVPFVRTYIPVAAGVGKMPWTRFARFNVIGALVWGVGVTLLGAWLGGFAIVREHIEIALVLVVLVSITPIIIETLRHRRADRRAVPA
ncbi:MAG: VTT domain-containing protein [Demequinaceae bacterium]|nr:VTT domain-containing protein [Demequinaceae bacterium]